MNEPVEMYKKMYYRLTGVLAEAIEAMEEGRHEEAKNMLIQAEQDTEDIFILWEESEDGDIEAMKRIIEAECGYPEKVFMNRPPETFQNVMGER